MQTGQSEATHGERLDTRAQGAAGGADPHLEAVGKSPPARVPMRARARTARNGYEGGMQHELRELKKLLNDVLREQREALQQVGP